MEDIKKEEVIVDFHKLQENLYEILDKSLQICPDDEFAIRQRKLLECTAKTLLQILISYNSNGWTYKDKDLYKLHIKTKGLDVR